MRPALSRRIYEHLLERGYIEPGAVILDPFAGIGGFALEAMRQGLHFIGIELERPFCDLSSGCDCTGVTKADWVRYQGRLERVRYRDGRHICPRCLAHAKRTLPSLNGQLEMFGSAETASYRRNSGKIPHTAPHRYAGNLETWAAKGLPGTARVIQGDSRKLAALLGEAGGLVSSPPYAVLQVKTGKVDESSWSDGRRRPIGISQKESDGYGSSPGQLAALPPGDLAAALVSFDDCGKSRKGATKEQWPGRVAKTIGIVSSPPYAETVGSDDPDKRGGLFRDPKRRGDKTLTAEYGTTPGQLAAMRPGALVSSPPYAESAIRNNADYNDEEIEQAKASGKTAQRATWGYNKGSSGQYGYGTSDGQLAAMPVGVVSSPPYPQAQDGGGIAKSGTPAQVEECPGGYVSPVAPMGYGETDGQLGTETGDTFWSAAKTIMQECHKVLAPGAVAVWVLKAFVRDKAIVDFPGQWQRLGESCGFETLEWIRAWLVEDRGAQWDLWGNLEERTVERKSFFRILYEKKARAEAYWPELSRDDRAAYLWQARAELWQRYRRGARNQKRPTPAGILAAAQMCAYCDAGEPDIDADTVIDWEDVIFQRRLP